MPAPTPPARPRVLLADDHRIVLDGLASLLQDDFEIIGTVSDGVALVEQAERTGPDVVVVDVSMPRLNGIDATRRLAEVGCPAKVVILSMHADVTYASRALEAGALGYVLKTSAADELVEAIRSALRGRVFLSQALRTQSIENLLDPTRRRTKHALELTSRQREILQLLAEGKSAKEVGAILGISARTVETHKYKMMEDLGVKTSAQLIAYALRSGLGGV